MKFSEISEISTKIVPSLKTFCRLSFLRYFGGRFHSFSLFAPFAPKSLFRSKITFSLQNHFFAQKSLFRSKITFSLKNQLFAPSAPLVSKPSVACRFFGHLEVIFPLGVIFSEF